MGWLGKKRNRGTDAAPAQAPSAREVVRAYHECTKHAPGRFARGPGGLDWDNQPDPFRRWVGAPTIALERFAAEDPADIGPRYTEVYAAGRIAPCALNARAIARLFFDALAISAWKEFQGARWPLRVNPSSGNLHPTEAYLLAGRTEGLCEGPIVAHYAPREHALEVRCQPTPEAWSTLGAPSHEPTLWVGLTSIHWREAWKYGERAWRYCQHDVGHALAALSLSAAGLGWRARLVERWPHADLALLLGLDGQAGPEAETPDALIEISPDAETATSLAPPSSAWRSAWRAQPWRGEAAPLSPEHVEWDVIEAVASASELPTDADLTGLRSTGVARGEVPREAPYEEPGGPPWRDVVHHRRSAVDMDGKTSMAGEDFLAVMRRLASAGPPFDALGWSPQVDLAVFVHRVEDFEPGLYLLLRDAARAADLRSSLRAEFRWSQRAEGGLALSLLHASDMRGLAAHASCDQALAGAGCFSLGMLADLRALERAGAWMYPRLYWECGAIGQVLYLEAEALGLRGTGIGCFYDDVVHAALGLGERRFQSLYHFAVGAPVEDRRLTTLPAYPEA